MLRFFRSKIISIMMRQYTYIIYTLFIYTECPRPFRGVKISIDYNCSDENYKKKYITLFKNYELNVSIIVVKLLLILFI